MNYVNIPTTFSPILSDSPDFWLGLTDRANRNNNPIPRNNGTHWTELETAFDAAFTDTAKQQNAHAALQQLTMRGDELDSYISTFKHLASRAGYALAEAGTVHLFVLGLKSKAHGRSLAPGHSTHHV